MLKLPLAALLQRRLSAALLSSVADMVLYPWRKLLLLACKRKVFTGARFTPNPPAPVIVSARHATTAQDLHIIPYLSCWRLIELVGERVGGINLQHGEDGVMFRSHMWI